MLGIKTGAARAPTRALAFLSALLLLAGPCVVHSAAPGDHPHHLSLIIGATKKSSKLAQTVGVEYTYRLNARWSAGGWYEQSFGDFELESLGVLTNLYVTDHFALLLGAGAERNLAGKSKYLGRIGASYQFHIGSATVAPVGWIDLIEDGK